RHTRSTRDWSSDVCSSDLQISVGSYPENAVSQTAGYTCSSVGPTSTGNFIINKATHTITVTGPSSVTYGSTGTATATVTPGAGKIGRASWREHVEMTVAGG